MQERFPPKNRRPTARWLLFGFALVALSFPVYRQMDAVYAHDAAGARMARQSEIAATSAQFGLRNSRFLPLDSPHPSNEGKHATPQVFEQPLLDHVLRSLTFQKLGADEKTARTPGFLAWILAAILFLVLVERRAGVAGTLAAFAAFMALPAASQLVLSSVGVASTLALSLAGIAMLDQLRQSPRPWKLYALCSFLFLAAQTSWSGYFVPLLLVVAVVMGWAKLRTNSDGSTIIKQKTLVLSLIGVMVAAAISTWIHADFVSGQAGQFLHAGDRQFAAIIVLFRNPQEFQILFVRLVHLFGGASIALVFACALQVAFAKEAKRWRGPWLFCLAWGLLALILAPATSREADFGGLYFLPLVAASYGIGAEVIARTLQPQLKFNAGILVAILVLGAFSWFAWTTPQIQTSAASQGGEHHRALATNLKRWIDPEDRRLLVTDYDGYDADILGGYLGLDLVTDPKITGADLASKLRPRLLEEYGFLRGQRVLFVVAPLTDAAPKAQRRHLELKMALLKIGSPYKGFPETIDISRWLWRQDP